jgi:hypothetical protein
MFPLQLTVAVRVRQPVAYFIIVRIPRRAHIGGGEIS